MTAGWHRPCFFKCSIVVLTKEVKAMIRNRKPVGFVHGTLRRALAVCLLLMVTASLVEAQRASSFTQLPLLVGPGDTITVTDITG